MSNSPPDPFKHLQHNAKYYITGGDLHILVDTVLFCVHSFFFKRDSQYFRDLLNTPVAPTLPRIGSSDSNAFVIKNTSPSEFEKFLWIFYNETYSNYTAPVPDWTAILKIACEFEFVEVKHCAIRGLQSCALSTVERIHIYNLYGVDSSYLVPLYAEMSMRDEAPTNEEIEYMGNPTSLLIFRLRELVRSTAGDGGKSPLPDGVDREDATDLICQFLRVDKSQVQTSSGSLRRRPRISLLESRDPLPMATPARRQSLDSDPRREVYVYGDYICHWHGQEGCKPVVLGSSAKDDVPWKTISGHFEVEKDSLKHLIKDDNKLFKDCGRDVSRGHTLFVQSNGGSVGVLIVVPARTFIFLIALSWTLILFWLLRHAPTDIRII